MGITARRGNEASVSGSQNAERPINPDAASAKLANYVIGLGHELLQRRETNLVISRSEMLAMQLLT